MNNKVITEFQSMSVQYENILSRIEFLAYNSILSLVEDNVPVNIDNNEMFIEFDWYDEQTDKVDSVLAERLTVETTVIDGNNIRLINVYDEDDISYDFSELPTDTQIKIAQNIIKQKE